MKILCTDSHDPVDKENLVIHDDLESVFVIDPVAAPWSEPSKQPESAPSEAE